MSDKWTKEQIERAKEILRHEHGADELPCKQTTPPHFDTYRMLSYSFR